MLQRVIHDHNSSIQPTHCIGELSEFEPLYTCLVAQYFKDSHCKIIKFGSNILNIWVFINKELSGALIAL